MRLVVTRGFAPGPQAYGATVAHVESFGLCEDGRTLMVMVELADERMACFQFCPGELITAAVVARCHDDDRF